MKLRFASWNVNNRNATAGHFAILRRARPDILALQEASPSLHAQILAKRMFAWGLSSLELRPPRTTEGRSRRLGCSLFGSPRFALRSVSTVPTLEFPERSLIARAQSAGGAITVCSFHTPPGTNWGEVKPCTLTTIAQWLSKQRAPLIFGIDANCPKTDHPDIRQNEWWWDEEALLLGVDPIHSLRDVLRVHLAKHPAEFARAVAARPNGPLAISHVRGNHRKRTDCRYDFVYATPDVEVEKVTYVFDNRIRSVTDHALIVADLQIERQTAAPKPVRAHRRIRAECPQPPGEPWRRRRVTMNRH
jgi:exonuclease III